VKKGSAVVLRGYFAGRTVGGTLGGSEVGRPKPRCRDWIKCSGTVEIEAIKRTFGAAAQNVAISATKSMHGHLVGASGALECAITTLALKHGRIPPTANLTVPDPVCDLDCVPGVSRDAPDLEIAISNSFAFGGSNATLALRRA